MYPLMQQRFHDFLHCGQVLAIWRETVENTDTPFGAQEYAQLWSEDECNGADVYDGWVNPKTDLCVSIISGGSTTGCSAPVSLSLNCSATEDLYLRIPPNWQRRP